MSLRLEMQSRLGKLTTQETPVRAPLWVSRQMTKGNPEGAEPHMLSPHPKSPNMSLLVP